jgi:hypothetical protein
MTSAPGYLRTAATIAASIAIVVTAKVTSAIASFRRFSSHSLASSLRIGRATYGSFPLIAGIQLRQ